MVDVAMNTEAAAVQVQLGRRAMSGFHAAYSVGGLAGAGLGAVAAAVGASAGTNFLAAAAVLMVVGVTSGRAFTASPAPRAAEDDTRRLRRPQWSWTLALLAAVAFGSFLVEGAANDWSAVYLHSSLRASPALAAGGYAVFACAMTAGRLVGDRLADRVGPARLVRLSAGVAAVSFGGALLAGLIGFGLVGFAVLGAGVSFVVPLVFTAASDLGRPGPNLAVVSSSGYLGMLIGPPLIGGLAEIIGLAGALSSVVVICALIAILAPVVAHTSSPASEPDASPQNVAVL
jgi:fucose permease